MTQSIDANSILMGGGGAPRAKFDRPGTGIAGRIVAISQPYQEREYDPNNPGGGAPKFYPKSGDPIMSFHLDLATTERDASVENDDGTRRVYMDGKRIKDAVRAAIRAAGATGLEIGGQLQITYTHDDDEGDHRSGKNYQVSYTSAANTALMGDPTPSPAPAPQGQPAWGAQAPAQPQYAPPAQQGYAPPAQAAPQQLAPVQQVPAPAPQQAPAAAAPALPPGMTAEQYAAFVAYQQSQAQQQPQPA